MKGRTVTKFGIPKSQGVSWLAGEQAHVESLSCGLTDLCLSIYGNFALPAVAEQSFRSSMA